jgi:hypothetical protein
MKAFLTSKRTVFLSLLVAILFISWLRLPSPGLAIMALPDIGINYQTMKVNQEDKLTAAGMKYARNGDGISMRTSPQEGKIIFRNLRTNEELAYPPAKQKEK